MTAADASDCFELERIAMGLALEVGILADLKDNDEEGFAHMRMVFDAVNMALAAHSLPPHHEPIDLPFSDVFSCSMPGYSGLHAVRRLAAYLWCGKPLPPPGREQDASRDPLLARFYQGAVPAKAVDTFEHLIHHSDAEGFYLPIDFPHVLQPDPDLEIPGGSIGSSQRLLAECRLIVDALKLPEDLDPDSSEVEEAMTDPGVGPEWRAYGVEAYGVLQLCRACEASIRTGAAVVFT